MGVKRSVATFEDLGLDERPKRCRCVTALKAAPLAKCFGPNNGKILPGQRHYVVRDKKTGKVIARYCGIACYDSLSEMFSEPQD